uniref:Transcription factor bZIP6 n=1 Tax=Diospyros kaki TaxID=35925 RepID=A0A3Q8TCX7_DIOKA|nr:transcription factor bZIP6 [Diospyros kaki]
MEEVSGHGLLSNPDTSVSNQTSSAPVVSFLGELLNSRTCTHTHTCNPPGPDASHTHTCYHTHTQVLTPHDNDDAPQGEEQSVAKRRRPSGNREAVRKYREKKKAQTAYLEEEVKKLRLLNQQLVSKLQRQPILEDEVLRLRGLLLDLRAKIDDELVVFPFQKQCNVNSSFKEGDCGLQPNGSGMSLQCDAERLCFCPPSGTSVPASSVCGSGKAVVSWAENCQPAVIDCRASATDVVSSEGYIIDAVETGVASTSQAE